MGVAIFFLLALIAAGFIAYPLLPGRRASMAPSIVTDGDIDRAVRTLRRASLRSAPNCPSCGRAYEPGDRFCAGCGRALSQTGAGGPVCPSCGAPMREEDRFCARCGAPLSSGEGV